MDYTSDSENQIPSNRRKRKIKDEVPHHSIADTGLQAKRHEQRRDKETADNENLNATPSHQGNQDIRGLQSQGTPSKSLSPTHSTDEIARHVQHLQDWSKKEFKEDISKDDQEIIALQLKRVTRFKSQLHMRMRFENLNQQETVDRGFRGAYYRVYDATYKRPLCAFESYHKENLQKVKRDRPDKKQDNTASKTIIQGYTESDMKKYEDKKMTRGHVAPCGSYTWLSVLYDATFLTSNFVPTVANLQCYTDSEQYIINCLISSGCTCWVDVFTAPVYQTNDPRLPKEFVKVIRCAIDIKRSDNASKYIWMMFKIPNNKEECEGKEFYDFLVTWKGIKNAFEFTLEVPIDGYYLVEKLSDLNTKIGNIQKTCVKNQEQNIHLILQGEVLVDQLNLGLIENKRIVNWDQACL